MKIPYLPLYYNDLRGSTQDWTDEEFGAYVRLLIYQWDKGAIPKEMVRLKKIAYSAEENWELLVKKFDVKSKDSLQNSVMEIIRIKKEKHSKKQQENIKKRWVKDVDKPPEQVSGDTKVDTKTIPDENQKDTKKIPLENEYENEYKNKNRYEKNETNEASWDWNKKQFLADYTWKEKFIRDKNIAPNSLEKMMLAFISYLEAGNDLKDYKEMQRHFQNRFLKQQKETYKPQEETSHLINNLKSQ